RTVQTIAIGEMARPQDRTQLARGILAERSGQFWSGCCRHHLGVQEISSRSVPQPHDFYSEGDGGGAEGKRRRQPPSERNRNPAVAAGCRDRRDANVGGKGSC